jgi:hypothetical protein
MTANKYPLGWNEARVRRVLDRYESQTDEEAATEIEAARTTMEVPVALVPAVRQMIARRGPSQARQKKTIDRLRILAARETKPKKRRSASGRGKSGVET